MKVVSIVGARPQFIKAAVFSRQVRQSHEEILIHTGQHFDEDMSSVFFKELSIPEPEYNLGIGGGAHGEQTGRMLIAIEPILQNVKPDWVVVFGDTNSTLAGALAAAKLHYPIAHIEAGLRSFNRKMPEEINRVLTDHVSDLLFVPSDASRRNLLREGIQDGIHAVGDIMVDAVLYMAHRLREGEISVSYPFVRPQRFYLATVHRANNTDEPERLRTIISGFNRLDCSVVWPVHPRTRKRMQELGIDAGENVLPISPVSYAASVDLLMGAEALLTDSGGMQKEAYVLGTPCITLRDETEWTETVDAGWNTLVGASPEGILRAAQAARFVREKSRPDLYGSGDAGTKIVSIMANNVSRT